MKTDIENNLSRETWLLIVLIGTFVYYIITAHYLYWYDIIYTSVALVITGALFLFLFNLSDGKAGKLNIGSMLRLAVYLTIMAIGAVLLIPVIVYLTFYGATILFSIGLPTEYLVVLSICGGIILVGCIIWGINGLWNMAKDYTLHFQYERPESSILTERPEPSILTTVDDNKPQ